MSDNQEINFNEFVNLLKQNNDNFKGETLILSLNKEVHTKPMNAIHLKDIIKTALSGVFVNNAFTLAMFNILRSISDPSISLSAINILDKQLMLLELRKSNVGNNVKIELASDNDSIEYEVNLTDHINKIKKMKFDFADRIIQEKNITLTLNYPSIETEYMFEKHFDVNIISKKETNDKNIASVMFFYYLTQFVNSVTIDDNYIYLLGKPISERLAIIENIPGIIIKKLIEDVNNIYEENLSKILSIEIEKDDKLYKGKLEITPGFFT